MRDAALQERSYAAEVDLAAYVAEQMRVDATIRQMEIVGDSGKNVSMTTKTAHSEVDWRAAGQVSKPVCSRLFQH